MLLSFRNTYNPIFIYPTPIVVSVCSLRTSAGTNKFIVSSSNNIFYIQIHHFTQKTMPNQSLYYTIPHFEPNTKSRRGGNHPPLVADVAKNSLVARGLIM